MNLTEKITKEIEGIDSDTLSVYYAFTTRNNTALSFYSQDLLIAGALIRFSKEGNEGLLRFSTLFNSFKDSYQQKYGYDEIGSRYNAALNMQSYAEKIGSNQVFNMLESFHFDKKYEGFEAFDRQEFKQETNADNIIHKAKEIVVTSMKTKNFEYLDLVKTKIQNNPGLMMLAKELDYGPDITHLDNDYKLRPGRAQRFVFEYLKNQ
ncbi:MAG: hypothetical protein ACMXX7_00385 [Candidatus Woesearchaeota archaeon]